MAFHPPTLVVIVPTRGRAERIGPLVEAFKAVTPNRHRLLFVVDPDDPESQRAAGDILVLPKRCGYPVKVNAGIVESHEALILVGADDILPHEGWFEAAYEKVREGADFVATNDLGNEDVMDGELATHPLVTRAYADQGTLDGPGLYHDGYFHNGADIEATATAKHRDAFAYAPESIIEHLHPNYSKSEVDQTYLDGGFHEANRKYDAALFAKREPLWNPLHQSV